MNNKKFHHLLLPALPIMSVQKLNGITSLSFMGPYNLGITGADLSGLEQFEGFDPADLVPKGYAIVHVDSRGSFDSEGITAIMGTQEAEDGYDVNLAFCSSVTSSH